MSSERYPVCRISRHRMGLDGKGIRTLVFMHGCPLRCKYCINPFSWDEEKEFNMMTSIEIYDEISIDLPYMLATGGGITFGGGEPLLHPNLFRKIRVLLEPKLTIIAETSLHIPWDLVNASAAFIDKYFIDIKSMDPDIYREYTGKEIELVLNNLKQLLRIKDKKDIVIRIPLIPGLADKISQETSRNILEKMGFSNFDLFEYRIF